LLVGHFYVKANPEAHETQIYRIFPHWFTDQYYDGEIILQQYHSAIREWGYCLDSYFTAKDDYPGQLDRCQWANLGDSNFLGGIPSCVINASIEDLGDLKSFIFSTYHASSDRQSSVSSTVHDNVKHGHISSLDCL
jgi:hypothetical protein